MNLVNQTDFLVQKLDVDPNAFDTLKKMTNNCYLINLNLSVFLFHH